MPKRVIIVEIEGSEKEMDNLMSDTVDDLVYGEAKVTVVKGVITQAMQYGNLCITIDKAQ